MKGGGDATSAARAVLQTGEYDFAWNLQVEDEVLTRLEASGKGKVRVTEGGNLEFIQLNSTDPNVEVDGERSSVKTVHPTLSRPGGAPGAVAAGGPRVGAQIHLRPRRRGDAERRLQSGTASSRRTPRFEFNVDKAIAILDKAGWKPGADGTRAKDGKQLKYLFQTSTNGPRQKTQQIVKQAFKKGRHRGGAEVGDRVRVLLVRRGQPGHLPAFLRRPADVHDRGRPCRTPAAVAAAVPVHRVRAEGQQVAGPQHLPLEERRVRRHLQAGRPPSWTR